MSDTEKPAKKNKGGRPATNAVITMEVVKRVGERLSRGIPLVNALALERHPQINKESFHKAVQRNKDFRAEIEYSKGVFLDQATSRLVDEKSTKGLQFILERRHSEDFGRKAEVVQNTTTVNTTTTINGLPVETLQRLRAIARERASVKSEEPRKTLPPPSEEAIEIEIQKELANSPKK